jgi:hypothetical protein
VAVLTKVVQEQKQSLDEKSKTLESVLAELGKLRAEVAQIKDRVN